MRCDDAHDCTLPCRFREIHHTTYEYDDQEHCKYEHDPCFGVECDDYDEGQIAFDDGFVPEFLQRELPELPPTIGAIHHALLTRPTRWTDLFFDVVRGRESISLYSRVGLISVSETSKGGIRLRVVAPLRSRAQALGAEITIFGGVLCTRQSAVLDLNDPGSLTRLDEALALFDAAI